MRTYRVIRRPSPPVPDTEHPTLPKAPPERKVDAYAVFYAWRDAVAGGHQTMAQGWLAKLERLAARGEDGQGS
jgi:hypothetical protein